MLAGLYEIINANVQLIWQTGPSYYAEIIRSLPKKHQCIKVYEFLNRMDFAYAAADMIISRAGAGTIAELCAVGKPTILVPSPNVAEDHQTKNAKALVERKATFLITDSDAEKKLVKAALNLIIDTQKGTDLGQNMTKMTLLDADEVIANEILKIANEWS